MNSSGKAPRLLREHEPCYLTKEQVPEELSGCLHERVGPYIEVDYPSPKTGGLWKVTPSGWVGYLPLGKDFSFSIQPKVSLENLFGMLEVAYDLKSFRLFEGLAYCKTLEEFYERLATILCRRVLDRARMGLYRSYVQEDDRLPFLRGRLDLPSTLRRPWSTSLDCSFQEHTADLDENRILGWTLTRILAAGPCGEKLRALARKAFHSLQGHASLVPYSPASCSRRQYNRLNLDYQPMHALCRFFLEHSGPSHVAGERASLPFLVDMARLFERFVARYLLLHPPQGMNVRVQEVVQFGAGSPVTFAIDILLASMADGRTGVVLDTKYKADGSPSSKDIEQIVAYCTSKECKKGVLVYPWPLSSPFNETVGSVRVSTLCFDISGGLEQGGLSFLRELCTIIETV